jgi:predicted dienelactone hydrolase
MLFLLGCEPEPPVEEPLPIDPVSQVNEPGDYAVGYRSDEVVYTVGETGESRTLRVSLWYPSTEGTGSEVSYQGIFDAPNVWEGASAVPGPYPVLVYSHGHQGYAEASGRLMAHFASHGWIVAAPDHTNNTTWDGSNRDTEIYYQRPLDISATLDHLAGLPQSDPLSGGETDQAIAIGHSFGGYTTYALAGAAYAMDILEPACEDGTGPGSFCSTMDETKADYFRAGFYDDRLLGIIAMASGDYDLFQASGLDALKIPVLHLTGELDPSASLTNELYWDALAGQGHRRVHILGGGHQTFTDFSGVLEQFDGLIEAEEGDKIVRTYALAFAQTRLGQEDRTAILDGSEPVSDAAQISE